jgi:hypothetical protein
VRRARNSALDTSLEVLSSGTECGPSRRASGLRTEPVERGAQNSVLSTPNEEALSLEP